MIATPLTIDTGSPETGWPPFLDWLRCHDLDPMRVRSVSVSGAAGTAELLLLDENGHRYVDPNDPTEPAVEQVSFAVHTPPPRRTQERA